MGYRVMEHHGMHDPVRTRLRDAVFGTQDGLISTLGALTGIAAGTRSGGWPNLSSANLPGSGRTFSAVRRGWGIPPRPCWPSANARRSVASWERAPRRMPFAGKVGVARLWTAPSSRKCESREQCDTMSRRDTLEELIM